MPMYEYQCAACGHRLEAIQKFSDKPLKSCPKCKKAKLERLLSSPAIQFKGTGWYITDYARKNSPDHTKAEKAEKESKESKSESASTSSSDGGAKESAKPAAKADTGKSASTSKK
jgi:putative FmdB family regulatory protein